MKVLDAVQWGRPFAVAWVAACVVAPFWRPGWAVLAGLAVAGWLGPAERLASNHLVLIGWVATILAVSPSWAVRSYLLRVQAVVVYAFATLNKAVTPAFLTGHVIASRAPDVPLVPLSVATVLVEAWLALAVWRRSRWALPVAVVLHAAIVAAMGTRPYEWAMLASFNGIMVLVVYAATGPRFRAQKCSGAPAVEA